MARRDSLFSLACWIAFHRAFWVGVGVRPHVIGTLLVTSFTATLKTVGSSIRTSSKAAGCRCWYLLMWWSPTLLTMRRSSGPGDQGLTDSLTS